MADGISFHFTGFDQMKRDLVAIDRRMERATMWALREVARAVRTESRRRAPKDTGALRRGIAPSRRFERQGKAYVIRIGPRGDRVHLYAGAVEARTPYMRPGFDAAASRMGELHARAWERSMRRR